MTKWMPKKKKLVVSTCLIGGGVLFHKMKYPALSEELIIPDTRIAEIEKKEDNNVISSSRDMLQAHLVCSNYVKS